MSVPTLMMGMFAVWDAHERIVSEAYRRRCEPFPLPENPSLTSRDVSVVICTINPGPLLIRALHLWEECNPAEIIVVTIDRDLEATEELVGAAGPNVVKITRVKAIQRADHRAQQSLGIKMAHGSIIIMADDDTFCSTNECIKYLLAPFEKAAVGAVNNLQYPDIPAERRDPNIVTPWEHISARAIDLCNDQVETRYGADGIMWTLIGRAMAFRAEIIKDPDFIRAFNNERFLGAYIKTGSDNFFSSWAREHGWRLVLQCADQAAITTTPIYDSSLVGQKIRWQRNSFQVFLRTLTYRPGFAGMLRKYPYMARKMLERVFRPVIQAVHFVNYVAFVRAHPFFGALLAIYYLKLWYRAYHRSTGSSYPWMARYWWASLLWEWVGLYFIELYAWVTIFRDGWFEIDDDITLVD